MTPFSISCITSPLLINSLMFLSAHWGLYSFKFMVSCWLDRDFFKYLKAISSLCHRAVCVYWGTPKTLSHAIDSSSLASTSCLCRGLKTAGISLEHSPIFLEHVDSRIHVLTSLDSQEYVAAFQIAYGYLSHFSTFPSLLFLLSESIFFVSNIIHCLRWLQY